MNMCSILLVEPNPLHREIIREFLEDSEYLLVSEALNGYETISLMIKCQPDVILIDEAISDIGMPQLLALLKHYNAHTKVVLMATSKLAYHQRQIGQFDSEISKPFSRHNLFRVLNQLTSSKTLA